MKAAPSDEILWRHLRDLPYFRAMVRAVEDSFYQGLDLPAPVLDLGCGDGHFTSVAFDHPLDVGLDPWWGPLQEVARVIRPGGRFVFCVPNHRFPKLLLGTQTFNRLGLKGAADWYSRFFNRISRHQHTDSFTVWKKRMDQAGFTVDRHWDYFPARALHRMEVGHAMGLPALMSKKLTGRWVLAPSRASLWLPWQIAKDVFYNPISPDGVYSFYITHRKRS